jgi:hypothetical protein
MYRTFREDWNNGFWNWRMHPDAQRGRGRLTVAVVDATPPNLPYLLVEGSTLRGALYHSFSSRTELVVEQLVVEMSATLPQKPHPRHGFHKHGVGNLCLCGTDWEDASNQDGSFDVSLSLSLTQDGKLKLYWICDDEKYGRGPRKLMSCGYPGKWYIVTVKYYRYPKVHAESTTRAETVRCTVTIESQNGRCLNYHSFRCHEPPPLVSLRISNFSDGSALFGRVEVKYYAA